MIFNVYDRDSILSYLTGFCDDPATARLLVFCLEKPLSKGAEGQWGLPDNVLVLPARAGWRGVVLHRFEADAALDKRVRHVADWLAAAVVNEEGWLNDLDDTGRPLWLSCIGTLAEAEAAADEYLRRCALGMAGVSCADGAGEVTVMTFDSGLRIVRLLTPAALYRDSAMMGHHVARGAYNEGLQHGARQVYSLRDRDKAHVTFEVQTADRSLSRCRGQSEWPTWYRHLSEVKAFVEREQLALREAVFFTGLVQDYAGRVYSVTALPDGLTVSGDLDLSDVQINEDSDHTLAIRTLPQGLTVGGYLYLYGTAITALPEGLVVGGNLNLEGSAITALSEGLTVGGSLSLYGTAITALPQRLTVGGDLDLQCTAVTALPEGLTVGGDLILTGTAITALPEGLAVGGDLNLQCTAVTALPEGLAVGGDLTLYGSAVTALPDGLTVGGDLNLYGTAITALPDGLTVGGRIRLPNGRNHASINRCGTPRTLN